MSGRLHLHNSVKHSNINEQFPPSLLTVQVSLIGHKDGGTCPLAYVRLLAYGRKSI